MFGVAFRGKMAARGRDMTTPGKTDPFAQLKTVQGEAWSLFAPMEIYTTVPRLSS